MGKERIEQFTDRSGGYERLLYVHENLQGNTHYYTKENGNSYAELTYDAWGMPESPNKLLNNDHGNYVYATYTGHIFDTTLDIYFAEARFYDANTRTWLAMDPIKDGGNWYQYCYSNPLKYWDPTGLEGFSLFGCNDINDITDWFHSNAKGMQRVLQGLGGVLQSAGSVTQIFMGASALATAISAIILSAPVSIPILAATLIGGAATVAFGGSNLIEGLNNIINAIKGDPASGINPIRDTIFKDSQLLYYLLNIIAGKASVAGIKNISSVIANMGATITKPYQMHHFATNKSKKYTSQFENIAKKYGLDLDGDWNKELMPHQGRHPNAYHDYILDNMQKFDKIANGDTNKFLKLFNQMKKKIIDNPEMLYKNYWVK